MFDGQGEKRAGQEEGEGLNSGEKSNICCLGSQPESPPKTPASNQKAEAQEFGETATAAGCQSLRVILSHVQSGYGNGAHVFLIMDMDPESCCRLAAILRRRLREGSLVGSVQQPASSLQL